MKLFSTPAYTVYDRQDRFRLILKKSRKEFAAKTLQRVIKRYHLYLKTSDSVK